MQKEMARLITERRKEQGLSRTAMTMAMQLAGEDISREVYKNIELGRHIIKVSELFALARLLDIDLNALRDASA